MKIRAMLSGASLWAVAGVAILSGLAGGAIAARLFAAPPVAAQAVPRLVTADTFMLQDRAGRARVVITSLADGRTGVAFLDEQGQPRAGLGFEATGQPGLAFLDEHGTPRAAFGLRVDGTPALSLFDQDGIARVELSVGADGAAQVTVGETQLWPAIEAP